MKKLFLLLIPIILITLCWCSNEQNGNVILRHETNGFGDVTYVVVELEDGIRMSTRNISLIVGDNVICKSSFFRGNICDLLPNTP